MNSFQITVIAIIWYIFIFSKISSTEVCNDFYQGVEKLRFDCKHEFCCRNPLIRNTFCCDNCSLSVNYPCGIEKTIDRLPCTTTDTC